MMGWSCHNRLSESWKKEAGKEGGWALIQSRWGVEARVWCELISGTLLWYWLALREGCILAFYHWQTDCFCCCCWACRIQMLLGWRLWDDDVERDTRMCPVALRADRWVRMVEIRVSQNHSDSEKDTMSCLMLGPVIWSIYTLNTAAAAITHIPPL